MRWKMRLKLWRIRLLHRLEWVPLLGPVLRRRREARLRAFEASLTGGDWIRQRLSEERYKRFILPPMFFLPAQPQIGQVETVDRRHFEKELPKQYQLGVDVAAGPDVTSVVVFQPPRPPRWASWEEEQAEKVALLEQLKED